MLTSCNTAIHQPWRAIVALALIQQPYQIPAGTYFSFNVVVLFEALKRAVNMTYFNFSYLHRQQLQKRTPERLNVLNAGQCCQRAIRNKSYSVQQKPPRNILIAERCQHCGDNASAVPHPPLAGCCCYG